VPAFLAAAAIAAAALSPSAPRADAVVAADGSAQYTTIQEAINAAPQETSAARRWVIAIKPGTYHELLYAQREKRFVMLVGDDPATTIVSYGLKAGDLGPDGKPIGTFRTPTAVIDADDFSVENLTFENAAGPNGQALALRVDGDRVVFRNCRFLGWQDTIFLDRGRQYFEDSVIAGHVDFIFGGATAWFERCRIHAWRNGYLTAASTPAETPYGFVFARGRITGEPGVQTYLGRPWRPFAQTAFIDTEMSAAVRPEGWHNWDKPEREATVRYGESGSTGSGGTSDRRVAWAKPLSRERVKAITVAAVLGGADRWSPASVPAHPVSVRALDVPLLPPGPR
jgi:pectinesterase